MRTSLLVLVLAFFGSFTAMSAQNCGDITLTNIEMEQGDVVAKVSANYIASEPLASSGTLSFSVQLSGYDSSIEPTLINPSSWFLNTSEYAAEGVVTVTGLVQEGDEFAVAPSLEFRINSRCVSAEIIATTLFPSSGVPCAPNIQNGASELCQEMPDCGDISLHPLEFQPGSSIASIRADYIGEDNPLPSAGELNITLQFTGTNLTLPPPFFNPLENWTVDASSYSASGLLVVSFSFESGTEFLTMPELTFPPLEQCFSVEIIDAEITGVFPFPCRPTIQNGASSNCLFGTVTPIICGSDIDGLEVTVESNTDIGSENIPVQEGAFSFPYIQEEVSTISVDLASASSETDLAFVVVSDIVGIAREILSIGPFSDSWQFIAGDVNLDTKLNVLDIIAIRRTILELDENLQNNWAFPPVGTLNSAEFNSQSIVYNNFITLDGELNEDSNIDFSAIRLGDVSSTANCLDNPEEPYISLNKILRIKNQSLKKGETIKLPITIKDFNKLSILDFGFQYDTKAIKVNGVGSGDLKMEKGSTHKIDAKAGTVRGIWFPESLKIADAPRGQPFEFFLEITALQEIKELSEVIDLIKEEPHNRIYPLKVKDRSRNQWVVGKSSPVNYPTIHWSEHIESGVQTGLFTTFASPNPFEGDLTITITSPEVQTATLQLFSPTGQTTAQQAVQLFTGENRVMLENLGHLAPGVYGYRVIDTNGQMVAGKVVKR